MNANLKKDYLKPCPVTKFGIIAHVLPLTAHRSLLMAHCSCVSFPPEEPMLELEMDDNKIVPATRGATHPPISKTWFKSWMLKNYTSERNLTPNYAST